MAKESGAGPSKKNADLNAVQIIRDALEEFDNEKREQIIRWARESLGLPTAATAAPVLVHTIESTPGTGSPVPPVPSGLARDAATFVNEKNPQTDMHLATTIAYYYRFAAPQNERKDEIDVESLTEACRRAGRPGALVKPLATLNNAHAKGLLDRGSARGKFVINSVGENLVGMTLPGGATQAARTRRRGSTASKAKTPRRTK